jgi:hypothetical protein
MARKSIELPPTVARSFITDMHAFFAVKDGIKRDEIAARQAGCSTSILDQERGN